MSSAASTQTSSKCKKIASLDAERWANIQDAFVKRIRSMMWGVTETNETTKKVQIDIYNTPEITSQAQLITIPIYSYFHHWTLKCPKSTTNFLIIIISTFRYAYALEKN